MLIGAIAVTLLTSIYTVLWLRGTDYDYILKSLKYRDHPLKDLYLFGFALADLPFSARGGLRDRKIERHYKRIYGDVHWEFYKKVGMAEKLSVCVIIIVIFPAISLQVNSPIPAVFGVVLSISVYTYFNKKIELLIKRRSEQILRDLPEVLSKLTLLIGAGLVTREAWQRVSESGGGVLYAEMKRASRDIDNGMSEFDAYLGVGERCGEPEVEKFISTFVQNLSKGSKDITGLLRSAAQESWNQRRAAVRMRGELASTKLLLPISLMFVGIFIMIMLPVMGGLKF